MAKSKNLDVSKLVANSSGLVEPNNSTIRPTGTQSQSSIDEGSRLVAAAGLIFGNRRDYNRGLKSGK